MRESLSITPNRLFAVAEAILSATQSEEGMNAQLTVWACEPPSGRSLLPVYTEEECVAAMSLLIRMGYIDPRNEGHSSSGRE